MAQMTHCSQVVVLDVSGLSPITDFLVLATGTSTRQMRSVCDDIEEIGKPLGFKPLTASGADGETWIVQDFIDVVVHVFSREARLFYDLDGLWGDAKVVDWQPVK
jgi:ribosome-associated protein